MSQSGPYLTVRQWTEQKAWPPYGGLRHLIFNAKSNGFDAVIRRVGRRVLIDEAAFNAWVNRAKATGDDQIAIGIEASKRSATRGPARGSVPRNRPTEAGVRDD